MQRFPRPAHPAAFRRQPTASCTASFPHNATGFGAQSQDACLELLAVASSVTSHEFVLKAVALAKEDEEGGGEEIKERNEEGEEKGMKREEKNEMSQPLKAS